MKVIFETTRKKSYLEITPTISFMWGINPTLYIGWIFWNIIISWKK